MTVAKKAAQDKLAATEHKIDSLADATNERQGAGSGAEQERGEGAELPEHVNTDENFLEPYDEVGQFFMSPVRKAPASPRGLEGGGAVEQGNIVSGTGEGGDDAVSSWMSAAVEGEDADLLDESAMLEMMAAGVSSYDAPPVPTCDCQCAGVLLAVLRCVCVPAIPPASQPAHACVSKTLVSKVAAAAL